MAMEEVTIAVGDEFANEYEQIVERCMKAGMQVTQKLKTVGVITGFIDSSSKDALRAIKGISVVEESRDIQLPPPDSDVQ